MTKYRIVYLAAIYDLGFCTALRVSRLHFQSRDPIALSVTSVPFDFPLLTKTGSTYHQYKKLSGALRISKIDTSLNVTGVEISVVYTAQCHQIQTVI